MIQALAEKLDGADDGQIPTGATLGSCDSRTWVASASIAHPVNPASYAIDGLQPTRWTTGAPQSVGQYVQIDFGGFVMIAWVPFGIFSWSRKSPTKCSGKP